MFREILDATHVIKEKSAGPSDAHQSFPELGAKSIGDLLISVFGEALRVLLVGSMTSTARGHKNDTRIGLIVTDRHDDDDTYWLRTGICLWETPSENPFTGEYPNWDRVQCLLG